LLEAGTVVARQGSYADLRNSVWMDRRHM
jgi:hypothetical protein